MRPRRNKRVQQPTAAPSTIPNPIPLEGPNVESPTTSVAPTALTKMDQQKEKIKALEEERDFLREQMKKLVDSRSSSSGKKVHSSSSASSDHDSSEEEERKKKKVKKSKKSPRKAEGIFGKRITDLKGVINRYQAILKAFQKSRSINRSCEKYDVDRNTLAYTAIIAEVHIAAETESSQIPIYTGGPIHKYAHTVKAFLDGHPQLKAKTEKMKADGELIPIAHKLKL